MGLWDIRPFSSHQGSTTKIRSGWMTAAQGFLPGEPIMMVAAGTMSTFPKDHTPAVLADPIAPHAAGIALNGPGAASSAELTAANGWGRLWIHPDSGETYANTQGGGTVPTSGNPKIWYVPFGDPDQLFITRIILAAGGNSAGAAFTGADIGDDFTISYADGTTPDLGWGLARDPATYGTNYVATIHDVLDANGKRVLIAGTGTFAVFSVTI